MCSTLPTSSSSGQVPSDYTLPRPATQPPQEDGRFSQSLLSSPTHLQLFSENSKLGNNSAWYSELDQSEVAEYNVSRLLMILKFWAAKCMCLRHVSVCLYNYVTVINVINVFFHFQEEEDDQEPYWDLLTIELTFQEFLDHTVWFPLSLPNIYQQFRIFKRSSRNYVCYMCWSKHALCFVRTSIIQKILVMFFYGFNIIITHARMVSIASVHMVLIHLQTLRLIRGGAEIVWEEVKNSYLAVGMHLSISLLVIHRLEYIMFFFRHPAIWLLCGMSVLLII